MTWPEVVYALGSGVLVLLGVTVGWLLPAYWEQRQARRERERPR